MKILSVERLPKDEPEIGGLIGFTVLIHGNEYRGTANDIPKMIEKILFKDRFASVEDIELDLMLNYQEFINNEKYSLVSDPLRDWNLTNSSGIQDILSAMGRV